jgi:hypothetical protein
VVPLRRNGHATPPCLLSRRLRLPFLIAVVSVVVAEEAVVVTGSRR